MTPTHANKKGVRYRYYVSHALLQGRVSEAGSVARVSSPDVEALIAKGLRANSDADDEASDREIIENHLGRAIVGRDQITITLRSGDLLDVATIRTMLLRSRSPSRRPCRCARESRIRRLAVRRSTKPRDRRC